MFKKIYWVLDKIRSAAIVGMLGYAVILSSVQIVLRYFASADLKPSAWGDEITRLMVIWAALLVVNVRIKQESHLGVQFFPDRFLSESQVKIAKKCATAMVIVALATVIYAGAIHMVKDTANVLQNLPDITTAWSYMVVPVEGFYLISEYAAQLFGWRDGAEREVGK